MTKFNHQPRNGKRRKAKAREQQPIGIKTLDELLLHREMEFLRNPTRDRARKLEQARRRVERDD